MRRASILLAAVLVPVGAALLAASSVPLSDELRGIAIAAGAAISAASLLAFYLDWRRDLRQRVIVADKRRDTPETVAYNRDRAA